MPIVDMSFDNPRIKAYFEGTADYAPVAELMYVHKHHLALPSNFLSQLENLINLTSATLEEQPHKKGVAIRIEALANRIAPLMNEISEKNAAEMLPLLREVYNLCGRIVK
jgi:hypothetical protein